MRKNKDYVSKEWENLVEELLQDGWSLEEAEQVADEECGYIVRRREGAI